MGTPIIHLGFDMGIRNLAYCMIRHEGETWAIENWDNVDLLEGGVSSQTSKTCVACSGPAKFVSPDLKKWCNGCATGVRRKKAAKEMPPLPALPCALDLKSLRELASRGLVTTKEAKKIKKDELLKRLATMYLMPWKAVSTKEASLSTILRAMDLWLNGMLPIFAKASLIRIENQPVLKGPTMKSVQIMLFTLLSHRLEREHAWKGVIEFVHAGTKSKSVELPKEGEGDAYAARKRGAEAEVLGHLVGPLVGPWLEFFNAKTKKSDLADAFLMAYRK